MQQLPFSTGPREIATENRLANRGITFSERGLERHCFRSRLVSRRRTFGKWQHGKTAKPVVVSRDAGIRERIVRIKRDRLVITDDGPGETIFGKRVPVEAAAQIGLVSLGVVGAAF